MFHCLLDSAGANGDLAKLTGQDDGTSESKSTQPRSIITSVTLYFGKEDQIS